MLSVLQGMTGHSLGTSDTRKCNYSVDKANPCVHPALMQEPEPRFERYLIRQAAWAQGNRPELASLLGAYTPGATKNNCGTERTGSSGGGKNKLCGEYLGKLAPVREDILMQGSMFLPAGHRPGRRNHIWWHGTPN